MATFGDDYWIHDLFHCGHLQRQLSRNIDQRKEIKLGKRDLRDME
jgi:hypothetical protein